MEKLEQACFTNNMSSFVYDAETAQALGEKGCVAVLTNGTRGKGKSKGRRASEEPTK